MKLGETAIKSGVLQKSHTHIKLWGVIGFCDNDIIGTIKKGEC